jgi:WD40 repeat protein
LKAKHPGHKISQFTDHVEKIKCRFAETNVTKGHSEKVTAVEWNRTRDDTFASASADGSLNIWNPQLLEVKKKIVVPECNFTCISFEPTLGDLLSAGSIEGKVFIFLPFSPSEKPSTVFKGHENYISSISFLDIEHLITTSGDRSAKIWDLNKGAHLAAELSDHSDDLMCMGHKDSVLLTGSCDRTVKQWDLRTGKAVRSFESFLGDVNSIKLISETTFLTGSSEGMVRLWDLRGLNALGFYRVNGKVECVEVSQSGRIFFSAGSGCDVKVWDLMFEDSPLQTLPRPCSSISLAKDGLLAGGFDENLVVWQHVRYG